MDFELKTNTNIQLDWGLKKAIKLDQNRIKSTSKHNFTRIYNDYPVI